MAFPLLAHAGLFSFVGSLLPSKKSPETSLNSQTVPILEAPLAIDPGKVTGGGEITIVGDSALLADNSFSGVAENIENRPSSDQISVYVVREGDTLSTIAELFDVSVNTIRWGNDISGSTISPGQTLVILPVSGVRHTVKKGDTLQSIAKLYKGDIDEIKSYNAVTESTKLALGDIIIVPDGEIVPTSSKSSSAARTITTTPSVSVDGYFIRPTTGPRTQGIHGYNGIDIAPAAGTPIVAAASGKVIVSMSGGWNGGYGTYVVISHPNGTQTLYAHMSKNIVSAGSQVKQGEVIGYVGATGKVTGTHLHFEIRGAKNPF